MRRYGVVVLLAALTAVGCSSGGGRSEPAPTPGMREAWQASAIRPIGQAVPVGDMVLVYGSMHQGLYLYGISVADGSVRWQQPATPGGVVGGIRLVPEVMDKRVVYFRPDRSADLAARLVVASPDTGADLLVSAPAWFTSYPSRCSDDRDVCVRVSEGGRASMTRRFSLEAGGPVADPGAMPPGSRYIGENLIDLGGRDPEVLARYEGGAVRWRSSLVRHFSPSHSTDRGWYFQFYRSAGLHVGSVGQPEDRQGTVSVHDFAKEQTAAINAATGSSQWRADGTRFVCDGKIEVYRKVDGDRFELWPVRCRTRGIARYDRSTGAVAYDGLDITVEGFDVATGNTTWSVPIGAAEAFMAEDVNATPAGDTAVLVQAATGPLILDVASGSTRAPAVGESFWCSENAWLDYRESRHYSDGGSSNRWRGGKLLRTCTADGADTPEVPRDLPRSLGVTVGDRTIVATAAGLVAYDRAT